MYSRATLATSVSLLGMLLMIGWPVHWVVSGEKGQTKDPDADVPNELSLRTITLHETNITLSNDIRELAN